MLYVEKWELKQLCLISVRFGRPCDKEENRAEHCASDQRSKGGVPAVILDQKTHAPAGKRGTRISEDARQTHCRSRSTLGGQVDTGDGEQALRTIDEKARGAKQASHEPLGLSRDLPE